MAEKTTPAIKFEKVSRHFDTVKAVDEADIEIHDGEFFSFETINLDDCIN